MPPDLSHSSRFPSAASAPRLGHSSQAGVVAVCLPDVVSYTVALQPSIAAKAAPLSEKTTGAAPASVRNAVPLRASHIVVCLAPTVAKVRPSAPNARIGGGGGYQPNASGRSPIVILVSNELRIRPV